MIFFSGPPNDVTISGVRESYKAGDELNLMCKASGGNPSDYTYVWLKDGEELDREMSANLKIMQLMRKDLGEYVCQASNINGDKESESVAVNILCK